jgi:hypothetical protein
MSTKFINNIRDHLLLATFCGLFFSVFSTSVAAAQKRVALVIGNSNYQRSPLANPSQDAIDMSKALKNLDFEVDSFTNLDRVQMRQAIRDFGEKLKHADVGLFYYAGHGIQIKGRNYLVPLKVDVHSADEVQDESIDAGSILRKMESAGNDVNIVILDACRNNPFARSFRSLNQGLARMDGPVGSFIAYATAPGSVAEDGSGRNGTYTHYLLEALNKPGLSIERTFKSVRNAVKIETGGRQIPWESSSLMGEFVFLKDDSKEALQTTKLNPPEIAKKYLQVISNVPNAKVTINNVDRGLVSNEGVLNIDNLTENEVEVVVQADGYQEIRKKVSLVPNQWEQLNITLIPNDVQTSPAAESNILIESKVCTDNKNAVLTTRVEYHPINGEIRVKRKIPDLETLLIQDFKKYGLKFVDLDLNDNESVLTQTKMIEKNDLQYLIRFSSTVNEKEIKILNTNMNKVSGDLSIELVDLKSKKIMSSVSKSFNKPGLDKKEILRTELKKAIDKLAKDSISQVCANL